MATKLGFTYTLSVDEKQSATNLKQSIKNIQQKNSNLSVPVNLKLNTTIPREMINAANETLKKKSLSLTVGLKLNPKSITNNVISEAQKVLNEKNNKLSLTVGLKLDTKTFTKLEKINAEFKEMKNITDEIISNVQKLAGVKLQVFEGVDGSGRVSSKGQASNTSDLQKEIDYHQTALQVMLEKLKIQKEYESILNDPIEGHRLQMLQERINMLGMEARTTGEVRAEARELKQEYNSIQTQGKIILWEDSQIAKGKEYYENLEKTSQALDKEIKKQQEALQTRYRSMSQSRQIKALVGEEKAAWERVGEAINKLNGRNISEVRDSARQLNQEMSNLRTDGVIRLNNVWTNLRETLISLPAKYMSIFTVINTVNKTIKDSVGYVKQLDDVYTDLKITMDIDKEGFKDLVDVSSDLAKSNGYVTESVLKMAQTYANADTTIGEVKDKLQGSIALANVSGMDAGQVTSAVQSVLKQFKMVNDEATNVSEATMRMGDVLVAVSQNMAYDFQAGLQELINGVDTAGSALYTAGMDLEWFSSILGSLIVNTGSTGSEVANAMKMIAARTLQQKQIIEEMGESVENFEIETANAEAALNDIGVSIRDGLTGELRDLQDILQDVAKKWDTLSDSSQQFVSEKLAGNNRRSYFMALMESMQDAENLYKIAIDAEGTLMTANEEKINSLTGRVQTLKSTMQDFYQTIVSSDALKSMVTGLTSLLEIVVKVSSFVSNNFVPVLGTLAGAFTGMYVAIKKITFEQFISFIMSLIGKMQTLTTTLFSAATAAGVLKVALGGIVGLGIAVLFSGIASAVGEATKSMSELAEETEQAFQEVKDGYKNSNDTFELIDQYKELKESLKDMSQSSEELAQKKEELRIVEEKLMELYPQAIEGISQEGEAIFGNVERYENLAKAEKEYYDQKLELLKMEATANKGNVEERINSLEEELKANQDYIDRLRAYQESTYEVGSDGYNTIGADIAERIKEQLELAEELRNTKDILASYEMALNTTTDALNENKNATDETQESVETVKESLVDLSDVFSKLAEEDISYSDALNSINSSLRECGNNAKSQGRIVEQFLGAFPQYADSVEDVSDVLGIIGERAVIEFGKAQAEAESFLKTMKESESYTYDMAEQLLDAYPELAGHIEDAAYVQDFLNDKIKEMQDAQDIAYTQMMAQDEDFWNNKIKNTEQWLDFYKSAEESIVGLTAESLGVQEEDFVNYINAKGGLREIDVTNAQTLAEAENMMQYGLVSQLLSYYGQMVSEKNGFREQDSKNIGDFLNWQGVSEAQTVDELKDLWAQYYNAKKAELTASINEIKNMRSALGLGRNSDAESLAEMERLQKQLDALERMTNSMSGGDLFKKIDTSFKGNYRGFSSGVNKGNLSTGTNSANKGSSSSKKANEEKEKEIANLELEIDRYYKLSDAIDDLNNKLAKNRALQNNAKDYNTRKKLMEEEIKLMQDKVVALENLNKEQNNELLDNKNILSSYGFTFDKEGNIQNYASQLKKLQDQANKLSGESKESAIEQVKWLEKVIQTYTELSNSSIPDIEVAIEELKYEIEQVNKEHKKQLELIEKLGNRYFDLEQAIKKVDNALALNQAKQQNATASERVKLIQEEIDLLKEKQKLLAEQKTEVQKEVEEVKSNLSGKGVKFNKDGSISNYKQVIENMKTQANLLAGDAREDALEEIEALIEKMEEYSELINETLPSLELEWEEYTNSIKEAERAKAETVASVEKDITSAITNEYQKRTDALKTELQKQKDAYNKQFEQEDWEDSLTEEQRKLDEIQQQINNLSRDTSQAGQLKLQQLLEEYKNQQKVIDDMIRDHEKEQGNARFDEELDKIDEELENALSPENLAAMVNQALVNGFVTIGDEVIELNSLMTSWLDETGDGLTAMGNILKEELIDNLEVAKQLFAEMGIVNTTVGSGGANNNVGKIPTVDNVVMNDVVSRLNVVNGMAGTPNQTVQIENLMRIDGNVTEDVLPEVQRLIQNAKQEVIDNIASELLSR